MLFKEAKKLGRTFEISRYLHYRHLGRSHVVWGLYQKAQKGAYILYMDEFDCKIFEALTFYGIIITTLTYVTLKLEINIS